MDSNNDNRKIEGIVDEFFTMASDDRITVAELESFTGSVMNGKLTFQQMKQLLNGIFTKTSESFESENDKKKLQCLKKVTSHLVDTFFESKSGLSDAIFFPGQEGEQRLIRYLNMAKHTLEVCVFTISDDNLARTLENLFVRGIKVRIITDDECANNKGSDIYSMAYKGVPVRTDKNMAHMHNKYAIVDSKILITGSFNWTWQAVKSNQENLLIVESESLVKSYHDNFEKLWAQFANNTISK